MRLSAHLGRTASLRKLGRMKEQPKNWPEAKRLFPDLGRYLRAVEAEISRHRGVQRYARRRPRASSPERAREAGAGRIELLSKRPK